MSTVGILALQGNYEAHGQMLSRLSVPWRLAYQPQDLDGLAALIMPGGESSALLHLMQFQRMDEAIIDFAKTHAVFGTCAGMILLASSVTNPEQKSLSLMNMHIARNAYGRQLESFVCQSRCAQDQLGSSEIQAVFIRAPKIVSIGDNVVPLAWQADDPILVRQGHLLAASFHPEMSDDTTTHQYFIEKCI